MDIHVIEQYVCKSCKYPNAPDNTHCVHCGEPLTPPDPPPT